MFMKLLASLFFINIVKAETICRGSAEKSCKESTDSAVNDPLSLLKEQKTALTMELADMLNFTLSRCTSLDEGELF